MEQKSLYAAVLSFLASIPLTGVLQVILLLLGIIAGYYAYKTNKAAARIKELELKKLRCAKD